ncbi:MAG: DUF1800 domain-containing protein [Bacteroidota bacterium]
MGNNVTRRDFLSQTGAEALLKGKKNPTEDPAFKKYANTQVPVARTQSGLNTYPGDWTEKEVLHLLRRTTFGASKAWVDTLKNMNFIDAVNLLIDNPQLPTTTPLNTYERLYVDLHGVPYGASWVDYPGTNDSDAMLNAYRTNFSFKQWWHGQMITQPMHILEKITLFWANHFSTQTEDFNYSKAIWQHYQKIRTNSLGNFSTFIKTITIDPHMLFFLNGNLNSASAPDENYARELQELFTIGKGPASAYTEDDVKQAAKILTGWRRQTQPDGFYTTIFDDTQHDTSDKQFSAFYNNTLIPGRTGQNGQAETDDLLNMILATDEAAKYICRCIYRWFVYYVIDDTTEQNIITPLAALLRGNNYEIAPVLKALFTSEHFFDPLNRGCIIKSPVDLYIAFRREFNVFLADSPFDDQYAHWDHYKQICEANDQKIGDPPNVAGWPAYYQTPVFYQAWINSDTVQKRAFVISNYMPDNGFPVAIGAPIKVDFIAYNQQFSNPGDPSAVVSNFSMYLLPQDVTADQTAFMLNILLNGGQSHYWTDAWNAYLANPTDNISKGIVHDRLKALVIYITNLEEYQLF